MRTLLLPLSLVYAILAKFRNFLFDRGYKKQFSVTKPVVSVGNLSVGGTGKTPIIHWLIERAEKSSLKPVVISRGYGSRLTEPRAVEIDKENRVELFGDEPVMLAEKNQNTPIYVGTDKVAVAELAIRRESPDIIFADDAFQHRRLRRDLEVVVVDLSLPSDQWITLPAGRFRESIEGLGRSDVVILSRLDLCSDRERQLLIDEVLEFSEGLVLSCRNRFDSAIDLASGNVIELSGRVMLVCGIGNPKSFATLVDQIGSVEVADQMRFKDHHAYDESDINKMTAKAKACDADIILTTEKDAVKLKRYGEQLPRVAVVKIALDLQLVRAPLAGRIEKGRTFGLFDQFLS